MAVYAVGVGIDLTENEARVALSYVCREAGTHDLVVMFDDNEVAEIDRSIAPASLSNHAVFDIERAKVFFDWSRDQCDRAEKTIVVTPGTLTQDGVPFCPSMIALVPRKGRVIWTREEVEKRFFQAFRTGRHFQRVEILDHDGVVIDALNNPASCTSMPYSEEFSLPDPSDDLVQIPIEQSR